MFSTSFSMKDISDGTRYILFDLCSTKDTVQEVEDPSVPPDLRENGINQAERRAPIGREARPFSGRQSLAAIIS